MRTYYLAPVFYRSTTVRASTASSPCLYQQSLERQPPAIPALYHRSAPAEHLSLIIVSVSGLFLSQGELLDFAPGKYA